MAKIKSQKFRCKCGETFTADLVIDAPVKLFLASLDAIRCPVCDGTKLFLVTGAANG